MRLVTLVLVAAWVAGIVSGVIGIGLGILLATAAVGLAALAWRFYPAVGVAAAALILLGGVWGDVSVRRVYDMSCEVAAEFSGRVTVSRFESARAQYELTTPAGCRVLLTAARFPQYRLGDDLAVVGKVQSAADIPDAYAGFRKYLRRRGFAATVAYPRIQLVSRHEDFLDRARRGIRGVIGKTFPEPAASLAAAMVLGESGSLPAPVMEAFRRVGVSHILAISGSNVTLLAGLAAGIFLALPLPRKVAALGGIALVWAYVALASFPVSAQRAAWFWTLVAAALQLHVLMGFSSVLILAGLFMVSFQPLVVYDAGWQLSFAAVIGIWMTLFLVPSRRIFWLPKWVSLLLLSSLGATLLTWPIVAYHFGLISLVSLPANLVVVPLTSLFMVLVLAALLSSVVSPLLALGIGFGAQLVWRAMVSAVFWLSSLPGAAAADISLPLGALGAYYVALAAGVLFWMKYQRRNWREVWE